MKQFHITSILLCGFLTSFSQSGRMKGESLGEYTQQSSIEFDHLEPVDSYFDYFSSRIEYQNKIRSFLLDTLKRRPMVRMLVLPSFSNEYVLNLEQLDGAYKVTKIIADTSIWYTQNPDYVRNPKDIVVKIEAKTISKELAEKISGLYKTAIDQTKFNKHEVIVFDGTFYYLTTTGSFGWRTATKKSPKKGTKIYELIRITETLISNELDESELINQIEKLNSRF